MDYFTAALIVVGILGGTALLIACLILGCEFFARLGRAEMGVEILEERLKTAREESRIERRESREETRRARVESQERAHSARDPARDEIWSLMRNMGAQFSYEPDGSIVVRIPPQ